MKMVRVSLGVLAAVAVLHTAPVHADYEVMESTVADLPLGTTVPEDAAVAIPEGGRVKLLRTGEGTTHELEGPYQGIVTDYQAKTDCPWWKKISVGCDGQSAPIGTRSTPSPDR